MKKKIILFANTAWYLYNFRLALAKALRESGYEVLLISPPDEYVELILREGFRWQELPMNRASLNPAREFKLLWQLTKIYKKEQPALVHHFTIKSVIIGSIAAKWAGVPAQVNAIAGLGYVFISGALKARVLRPVVKFLLKWILQDARGLVILQNFDDKKKIQAFSGLSEDKIRVVHGSGVNTARFHPAPNRTSCKKEIKVLLAARLLWDKGIEEFAKAAGSLKPGNERVRFLIAGEPDPGNPRSISEAVLSDWSTNYGVEILGKVWDMPALLREVDVFVLPTYREGLSKSLIEAGACGLPLVTTDVPGCREVIEDGVNGFLVPPRDVRALEKAICKLCEDVALRNEMGARSRQRVVAEFDERIIIDQTIKVYRELMPEIL